MRYSRKIDFVPGTRVVPETYEGVLCFCANESEKGAQRQSFTNPCYVALCSKRVWILVGRARGAVTSFDLYTT